MKHQIILIHGGTTFDTDEQYYAHLKHLAYDPFDSHKPWRQWIAEALKESYEVMAPTMPNKLWADYRSWSIWFEKLFPYLHEGRLVIVGHSLGGIFLAKYLSENAFPKHIDQLHLAAPVFDKRGIHIDTVGDFGFDPARLKTIPPQVGQIYIYHSHDDPEVPFSHSEKYQAILPEAKLITFDDRGHFLQETFPELIANIRTLDMA